MADTMDDVLARVRDRWAKGSSSESRADTEAAMEAVRATGTQHAGQSLDADRAAQEMGKRRLAEAIEFKNGLLDWLTGEARAREVPRWQGYFASAMLVVNLRSGCPDKVGGEAEFDRTGASATEWYKAKYGVKALAPSVPCAFVPTEQDIEQGDRFAKNLLDWFELEVNERGLDRWQGHFAAALLTVELRSTCPEADGGPSFFDTAVQCAWKYYEALTAKV